MNYVELNIEFTEVHPWRDIMISVLGDKEFDSFVETKTGLQSYIPETKYSEEIEREVNDMEGVVSVDVKIIQDQNWNAKWEENFDPVVIDDLVAIRAPFHHNDFDQKLVVTIQPQMSFGTGHHQTTWLMSKRLYELDLTSKSVLDMGTGTGVLAIIAEKKGAEQIFAPDIDEWSYRNAIENCELNDCTKIEVVLGDDETIEDRQFDVIAANINKNVLIQHFSVYSKALKPSGKMLISGFFETDQEDLKKAAEKHGFVFENVHTKEGWAMMEFSA